MPLTDLPRSGASTLGIPTRPCNTSFPTFGQRAHTYPPPPELLPLGSNVAVQAQWPAKAEKALQSLSSQPLSSTRKATTVTFSTK